MRTLIKARPAVKREYKFLSEKDVRTVVMATLSGNQRRGGEGLDDEQMMVAIKWAEQAVIDYAALGMVKDGQLLLDVDDGGKLLFVRSDWAPEAA